MSGNKTAVESELLRAVAVWNGRAKVEAFLYHQADLSTPIVIDEINLSKQADRAALVARMSRDDLRDDAASLLARLAAEVAAARAAAPEGRTKTAGASPFAEIEPAAEPVDGGELLDDLVALLRRYVILPPMAAEAIALWLLHTYVVDAADYTPYLLVTSPTRQCGKTTLEDLLTYLAWRAKKTDGITVGALYRIVDQHQPTILLDELDTRLRGDTGEALRGVLNSGFQRGGRVTICVGDDHDVRDFSTFCPKVLAGIGRVWDTVTSRSIPIRLARATRPELEGLVKIRGDRIAATCRPYQERVLRWANDHREQLRHDDPDVPMELGARQADVWRPLLAIADVAGDTWSARAREAARTLHEVAEEEGDYGVLVLEDIRGLFDQRSTDRLTSADIVTELAKREDRPWPEYRKDRPISATQVASLLRRFDVRPKNLRMGAEVQKGYEYAQLLPAFQRYLTQPLQGAATPSTEGKAPPVAAVAAEKQGTGRDGHDAPVAQRIPGTCMRCGRSGLKGGAAICPRGQHLPAEPGV